MAEPTKIDLSEYGPRKGETDREYVARRRREVGGGEKNNDIMFYGPLALILGGFWLYNKLTED